MTDADEGHPSFGDLERYLAARLGTTVTDSGVLSDGLNLVVAVDTDDGRYVVRRPNELRDAAYLLDLECERAVLERLDGTDVPTPEPVLYCADPPVLDGPFLVSTWVPGRVIPLGSDPPGRFRTPAGRETIAHELVDTLAAVHALDTTPFEGVCERLTPREQVDRCVARLDRTAGGGGSRDRLRAVADRLRERAPEPTTAFLHGDFRPGNVCFVGERRPAVGGVIDWETALLGDPRTELGYLLLRWHDGREPRPDVDALAATYPGHEAIERLRTVEERGLAPFTSAPGTPSRPALVARYEAATGIEYGHDRFYRAHAAFLLATVWTDLHRQRRRAGEPSDWEPHVEYMARLAACLLEE